MKFLATLIAAAALLLSLGPADVEARTFKWQDADGLMHFTQVPPPADCQTVSCQEARGTAVKLKKPTEIAAKKARYRTSVASPQGRKAPTAPPVQATPPAKGAARASDSSPTNLDIAAEAARASKSQRRSF